ncbi:MAG: metalloregulator ArsR/SmtB family transcription factor [Bacteroidia bacterium]|jgi:DNA-binding transcriptional ArsR family regulator|nr:metalloregulator ArsR/SmtB family transcription factor [Bacteroidia bacterium]
MGKTKTGVFTDTHIELAQLTKALGHPARIAILELLIEKNACICGDLVEELPLSQSTVSQHLKALKEAGLVQGEIEGPRTCYCIDPENWRKAELLLQAFFGKWKKTEGNCC